jgi:iron complex outermembrane recepter protein
MSIPGGISSGAGASRGPLFTPASRSMRPTALAAQLALAGCLGTATLGTAHAQAAGSLPPVDVSAQRDGGLPAAAPGGQAARGGRLGLLGNADTMKAPFSMGSFTAQAIEDQQAATAADIATRDSSVRSTGQTGGILDAFFIRGFAIGEGNVGEVAFDGQYGVAPNYRILSDYVERVEVLKGPGALLYGMSPNSGIGGVINIVPKRAAARDLTRVTANYGSSSQIGGHLDVSRRFGAERQWGVRVNASHHTGDTPLDNQSRQADVGAVAVDYMSERLQATLDLIGQQERFDAPSRAFLMAAGVAVPAAPDGRRNVTQSWEWADIGDKSYLLRAEYQLANQLVLFGSAGGGRTKVDRVFGTPIIQNAAGDTTSTPARFQFDIERSSAELGLRGRFDVGSLRHTVTLQASTYRDRLDRGSVNGTAYASNIYSPVARPAQSIAAPASVPKISDTDLGGWALADTLSVLDDRLLLTLGLRHQRIESNNFNPATGAVTSSYGKRAVTPMVGLVVRPWKQTSLFANYIEGLSKGDIAPAAASNAGEVFAPYKAKQHEVGVKFESGPVLTTVSLFQVEKPSGQLTAGTFAVDAEQRNRGLEVSMSGEATSALRLLGGLTVLDAELTKTNSAATQGKRPIGVPTLQANLGAEWDLSWLPGVTLTGALTHTGRQYIDATNARSIPAWTKVDLGARYRTQVAGRVTTFRANLLNAFDRQYWAGVASWGGFVQGAPRTLLLSAAVDF